MLTITRRHFLGLIAGSLTLPKAFAAAKKSPPSQGILAVRIWPANAYTRIALESPSVISHRHFSLKNPTRLVIDLRNVTLNQTIRQLPKKLLARDPYISAIRVARFNATTIRIVLDLKREVEPQIFSLKPVANFKHRLVIDLYPGQETFAEQTQNDPLMALLQDYNNGKISSNGTDSAPEIIIEQKPPSSPKINQLAAKRVKRRPIVVLDPGHGGEDPGAIGPTGLREKNVALAIAQEAKSVLEKMGYKVYMTRNEDVFIPLGVRVAKARRLKADVFVSIHADAFTRPEVRGTGVYALSRRGATSAAARYLERTQNAADLIGGVKFSRDKTINNTLFDLAQSATISDSLMLGLGMLKHLGKINRLHKKHVDQANFAVLRAPDIPSVLVETAFISNPTEEKLLRSANFRKQSATAIARGVKDYLDTAILANN